VRDRLATLTAREFEVLKCVIAGMLNKQIASQLGTTEGTIKVHRGRVMEKMGATSVAELVILAQKAGIAPACFRLPFGAVNPPFALRVITLLAQIAPHCFLRTPDGTFTNVDPPGSLQSYDLYPIVINPAGAIARGP
jgi:DNA-binding CsgD family transcriptional regulator